MPRRNFRIVFFKYFFYIFAPELRQPRPEGGDLEKRLPYEENPASPRRLLLDHVKDEDRVQEQTQEEGVWGIL